KVQMGGSDQWGNIVTGVEFIRRQLGESAYAITTQLIKKADGTKFGKTEGGAVWLDPKRTSPYKYYQFWLNASDSDAKNWIKIFTLKTKEEIDSLIQQHDEAPHLRLVQKELAKDITIRTHSLEDYEMAIKTSEFLFGNGSLEFLENLDEDTVLDIFDGVPLFEISLSEITSGIPVTDLLAVESKVFNSKGEAKKMIQGGGVALNKVKITDVDLQVTADHLINGKYLIFQRGKKNYFLLIAR